MNRKVKWGVLGYARIAKNSVIPALNRTENSEFYALASRDQAKLEECRSQFNPSKLYDSYQGLLDDPQVQAVYIPLPNSLHKEWAIKAMNQGKHVLCEKPLALTAAECEAMMAAAAKNRVLLMEAFMYRYTDRTKKVQEILASGEIGAIKHINSTFRFFLDRPNNIRSKPEMGGGSLYDVGCYPVNFVGMLTGKLPESYKVECILENGVDVLFSAVLRYSDGVIATINSGFNAFREMRSEIIGTKGRLEIPDTFMGDAGSIDVIAAEGARQVPVSQSDRYALEVADFAAAVLEGRKPMLSLDESLRNMRLIEGLMELVRNRE
jgi:xylose dehydrogenase (NAD/NADP)